MCLCLITLVFHLGCVAEYLDTMVTDAIETNTASREVEQRKGGPRTPGPGGSILVTPMFTLSRQCYWSCVLCITSLPRECKCRLLPVHLYPPGALRGGEMLNLARKDVHPCHYPL